MPAKPNLAGLSRADLEAIVEHASPDQLRDLLASIPKADPTKVSVAKSKDQSRPPRNDDELHAWIIKYTGYDIPRVAVCDNHRAPFEFVADAYFERKSALFLLGSRELGKTLNTAILHYINSETKPGCESITFGAIDEQARRAYKYIKEFVFTTDHEGKKVPKPQIDGVPMRRETHWKSGSLVEIIVGSASGVNSPHDQKVHADEVDLMDPEVFRESRNISSSKELPNGEIIAAQDYATSTRKSMHGPVQKIINECEAAIKEGFEPPWEIYSSCVFEAAREVPCCRKAPRLEREARLAELGTDIHELCSCDRTAKGEWVEGVPRTLESVCRGRFFKSRGWMRHEDIKRKFRANDQVTWEAQMECTRPMSDGLYLPGWTRNRYTVQGWIPRPDLGSCYEGIDWGGSAESVVLFTQGPLRVPVSVIGAGGTRVTVPIGAYVVFDEIVDVDIGATKLADKTYAKEVVWGRAAPGFRITARFADMAGKQQRDDWREHTPPLRTSWWLKDRAFDPTVKTMQDLVGDGRYWVASDKCARHCDDIESWRQKDGREVHDESSHTCAGSRYVHSNVEMREKRRRKTRQGTAAPVVVAGRNPQSPVLSGQESMAGERSWRGMPRQLPGSNDWRP